MKKETKWIRFRHRLAWTVLTPVFKVLTPLIYGCRPERFQKRGGRPYLILFNHQTVFDEFLVGLSFGNPVYFVATDDLFSKGIVSFIIRFFLAPIPYRKRTLDIGALRKCVQAAREGGNIALAPEGNITYSGKTETIRPSIAGLVKMLKMPVALYRIEGGFGVQPRWCGRIRRGKMRAYVSRVIEPEEYEKLSKEELYEEIRAGLTVNDCLEDGKLYRSSRRAEYLERTAYYCPWCGLSVFRSKGNRISCTKCGRTAEYGEDLRLKGVNCDFPYTWYTQWWDAQEEYVRAMDPAQHLKAPVYLDTAALFEVLPLHRKQKLRRKAELKLYGDRIVIDEGEPQELLLPFSDAAAAAVQMRNKLSLCMKDGKEYQVRGDLRFNPAKYINFIYRYRQVNGKDSPEDYLGF